MHNCILYIIYTVVLLVHGGPWARDSYGFNQQAQWFANRGYATLQVGVTTSV